jgi:uncharacterized protein YlxW (UPF0749 family)
VEAVTLIFQSYAFQLWLILLLLVILLGLWLILLYRQLNQLRQSYGALLASREGKDLGELLGMYVEQMRLAASKADQLAKSAEQMERQLRSTIQRIGLIRFNAFEDTGGEQSFALALLDAQGDGIVVSSLQRRADTRLYAKPVKKWDSTYKLSVEEKEAIAQAYRSEVDT